MSTYLIPSGASAGRTALISKLFKFVAISILKPYLSSYGKTWNITDGGTWKDYGLAYPISRMAKLNKGEDENRFLMNRARARSQNSWILIQCLLYQWNHIMKTTSLPQNPHEPPPLFISFSIINLAFFSKTVKFLRPVGTRPRFKHQA